eukprot:GEMP01044606.1.p2 GENE.GEMP01044606.1~~GEMP01044606.1.p2  ORF type:complete len:104 (-),score=2.77 GEMP01044606.1:850-1161(-)
MVLFFLLTKSDKKTRRIKRFVFETKWLKTENKKHLHRHAHRRTAISPSLHENCSLFFLFFGHTRRTDGEINFPRTKHIYQALEVPNNSNIMQQRIELSISQKN